MEERKDDKQKKTNNKTRNKKNTKVKVQRWSIKGKKVMVKVGAKNI